MHVALRRAQVVKPFSAPPPHASTMNRFESKGAIVFDKAMIKGDFDCRGVSLRNENDVALSLLDATIVGSVRCTVGTAWRVEAVGTTDAPRREDRTRLALYCRVLRVGCSSS